MDEIKIKDTRVIALIGYVEDVLNELSGRNKTTLELLGAAENPGRSRKLKTVESIKKEVLMKQQAPSVDSNKQPPSAEPAPRSRAGLMDAITARGDDRRSGLMAAISARCKSGGTDSDRGGLLATIAARGGRC
jgi:hypothetical protein